MKRLISFFQFLILLCFLSCNDQLDTKLQYIDPIKPENSPLPFAKGFITHDSLAEFGSVFNHNGTEFYYAIDSGGISYIMHSKLIHDQWTHPERVFKPSQYSFNDPFLSNDENKLYYISNFPRNSQDTIDDIDIWYSNRTNTGWSEPINAGSTINTNDNEYYISFTNDRSLYYASNHAASEKRKHDFDIYKLEYANGAFKKPIKISEAINSRFYEADAFVAPDESYLIFCSFRRSGLGKGDLYISFKDERNNWTEAQNMGPTINSETHQLCPFVTKDGKYFFYTSDQDIYWVSTDIFEDLR